ncbi:MAG: M15 family metallopeptidase [Acidimicrobiia bacterium]|nr:M15 family metallopeptidase [Acidimicrobiia bacterium]
MNGIAAVQGRIAAIEARFGATTPAAPTATAVTSTFDSAPTASPAGSFGTVFRSALGARDALTPAHRLAPGAYGRLQPPAELIGYGNGRIPAGALTSIGDGNHRLHAPAARAYEQMIAAARADGVDIGITDSYRDIAGQQRLAAQKGLYSRGGLAATPGTSNHGWGLSVDLDLDAPAQSWMRANGPRFGFVEDVPREPWHWTYRPS